MIELKEQVERLTRVTHEDRLAIIGNHMEEEFERRLLSES